MDGIDWVSHVEDLVMIWAVVNPVGTIAVFLTVTKEMSTREQRKIAIHSVIWASIVLMLLIVTGQLLLEALRIPLTSFKLAGGLVLFLFAVAMIFEPTRLYGAASEDASCAKDPAVFPLAIPAIASPGAMLAVVVLTDNNRYDVGEQLVTAAITLFVMFATLLLFLVASPIQRVVGAGGANVTGRLMGLILAAIAIDNVLRAISGHFNLA